MKSIISLFNKKLNFEVSSCLNYSITILTIFSFLLYVVRQYVSDAVARCFDLLAMRVTGNSIMEYDGAFYICLRANYLLCLKRLPRDIIHRDGFDRTPVRTNAILTHRVRCFAFRVQA